jgi:hypothetical protein
MPYKTRYLMQQTARGRPMPQGDPDEHLWAAIRTMSVWNIREAWEMGASPHARDNEGEGVLAAITRRAQVYSLSPDRTLPLLEDAWRQGSRLGQRPHEVDIFHMWLTNQSSSWWQFCIVRRELPWQAKSSTGRTAAHILAEQVVAGRWPQGLPSAIPLPAAAWEQPDAQGVTPNSLLSPTPTRPKGP